MRFPVSRQRRVYAAAPRVRNGVCEHGKTLMVSAGPVARSPSFPEDVMIDANSADPSGEQPETDPPDDPADESDAALK